MFLDNDGRNGWHHVFFWLAVFAAVVLSIFVLGGTALAAATDSSILDLSKRISLPDGNTGIEIPGEDALFSGTHNTFYSHALDMPLTRFILGNVFLDHSKLKDMLNNAAGRRIVVRKGGQDTVQDAPPVDVDWGAVAKINDSAAKVFRFLLGPLGAVLLGLAFIAQTVMIGYNGLVSDKGFLAVPLQAVFFRFLIFLLAILFFKTWVTSLITFSNYAGASILSVDAQKMLMNSLTFASAPMDTGQATLGSIVGSFFRALGVICVRILIILRDVLTGLTLVTGPTCIALGFFTTYGRNEPFRQYLSGWIKGFTTMLVWGVFAALVLNAMGIISILAASGKTTSVASGIFGLAALFAAKDIPKMSQEFGSVALASLLAMLTPAAIALSFGASNAMFGMVFGGAALAKRKVSGLSEGSAALIAASEAARAAKAARKANKKAGGNAATEKELAKTERELNKLKRMEEKEARSGNITMAGEGGAVAPIVPTVDGEKVTTSSTVESMTFGNDSQKEETAKKKAAEEALAAKNLAEEKAEALRNEKTPSAAATVDAGFVAGKSIGETLEKEYEKQNERLTSAAAESIPTETGEGRNSVLDAQEKEIDELNELEIENSTAAEDGDESTTTMAAAEKVNAQEESPDHAVNVDSDVLASSIPEEESTSATTLGGNALAQKLQSETVSERGLLSLPVLGLFASGGVVSKIGRMLTNAMGIPDPAAQKKVVMGSGVGNGIGAGIGFNLSSRATGKGGKRYASTRVSASGGTSSVKNKKGGATQGKNKTSRFGGWRKKSWELKEERRRMQSNVLPSGNPLRGSASALNNLGGVAGAPNVPDMNVRDNRAVERTNSSASSYHDSNSVSEQRGIRNNNNGGVRIVRRESSSYQRPRPMEKVSPVSEQRDSLKNDAPESTPEKRKSPSSSWEIIRNSVKSGVKNAEYGVQEDVRENHGSSGAST